MESFRWNDCIIALNKLSSHYDDFYLVFSLDGSDYRQIKAKLSFRFLDLFTFVKKFYAKRYGCSSKQLTLILLRFTETTNLFITRLDDVGGAAAI